MTESDEKVVRKYRELSREEPAASLDAAILAASRRALDVRPSSRRWAASVSIAAVLVLAFGVTLQIQRDEPGIESSEPINAPAPPPAMPAAESLQAFPGPAPVALQPQAAPESKGAPGKNALPARRQDTPSPPRKAAVAQPSAAPAPSKGTTQPAMNPERAFSAAPAPAASVAAPQLREPPVQEPPERSQAMPAAAMRPPAPAPGAIPASPAPARAAPRMKSEAADLALPSSRPFAAQPDPHRELHRIARLREEGRHADADTALDQLRRDHPGFSIPEAMWERVKPR